MKHSKNAFLPFADFIFTMMKPHLRTSIISNMFQFLGVMMQHSSSVCSVKVRNNASGFLQISGDVDVNLWKEAYQN